MDSVWSGALMMVVGGNIEYCSNNVRDDEAAYTSSTPSSISLFDPVKTRGRRYRDSSSDDDVFGFAVTVDLIYNVTLAVVSTFADIYCLLKLNYYRKTAANSILYVLMLVSFHIAECFEGVTSRFILTVIAWQIWLGSTP
ncbi:hypothetical protein OSTOST_23385 [Ostertagia ostertagi]